MAAAEPSSPEATPRATPNAAPNATTPNVTPKRKRSQRPSPSPATPVRFASSVSSHPGSPQGGGGNSPRISVAHRFRRLALADGPDDVDDTAARKRHRPLSAPSDAAMDTAAAAVDCPPEPKSPARRRAGTPPLRLKRAPAKGAAPPVADPVRAALTWHEDEITVYDPDDVDDDGTGINGIGFKPTPALAHARAAKRRQQMADYRRREESEARARRSQRRKGDGAVPPGRVVKKKSPSRRVRFVDAESHKLAVTTA